MQGDWSRGLHRRAEKNSTLWQKNTTYGSISPQKIQEITQTHYRIVTITGNQFTVSFKNTDKDRLPLVYCSKLQIDIISIDLFSWLGGGRLGDHCPSRGSEATERGRQWRIYGGGGGLGGFKPPLGLPSKNLMCIEKRHHNMSRPCLRLSLRQ